MSSLANVKYELRREARCVVLQVLQHKLYVETHVVPSNVAMVMLDSSKEENSSYPPPELGAGHGADVEDLLPGAGLGHHQLVAEGELGERDRLEPQ